MSIRLTQMTKKGGCAAKVPAAVLREVLRGVHFPPKIPEVIIDGEDFDDAAIIRVSDSTSLVQTLDFFTPVVDGPRVFGQIAAANALSDVYAMGGIPKTAMAILAFPSATVRVETVREILQGAAERIEAAGASLVGGHSIDDESIKFGLSVTGFVSTDLFWTNAGAKPEDVVFLTKPLGTGTLCAGLKQGVYNEVDLSDAIDSMVSLNDLPKHLPRELLCAVSAATDVTGFGLAGHAMQLALASGVTVQIQSSEIPFFPRALSALESKLLTRAHSSNREYTESNVDIGALDSILQLLVFDPQTSGGLLLCVSPDRADELQSALKNHCMSSKQIGVVLPREDKSVLFV